MIEISRKFLITVFVFVLGLGLGIYFLNNYDVKEKAKLVQKYFEYLENSDALKELKKELKMVDTLSIEQADKINSLLSLIKEDNKAFYHLNVIVEKNNSYQMINRNSYNHLGERKATTNIPMLNQKTAEVIDKLKKQEASPLSINQKRVNSSRQKQLIYPIVLSQESNSFLEINYYEEN